MFSGLPFYSWVIRRTTFSLKNKVRYLWTFKQQIALHMAFLKHNSLKSDIIFNPICIPCFSESMFFRVQVFHDPSFFRVQVIQGPGFSRCRTRSSFFRDWVQGLGPCFRNIYLSWHVWYAIYRHASSEGRGIPGGPDPCSFLIQSKLCPQICQPT